MNEWWIKETKKERKIFSKFKRKDQKANEFKKLENGQKSPSEKANR